MGKRSRKRPARPATGAPAPTATARAAARPGRIDRVLERAEQRPKPPWHPVPLVELSVLVGIVLLVIGTIRHDTRNGRLAIVLGLALASLAGLDTAAREHFAGLRSHSTLLAGVPAVIAVTLAGLAGAPLPVLVAAGGVVFAGVFRLARRAFRARAGVSFKV